MAAGAGSAGWRGGAGQIKGLRLLTMDRGPDGFGFHMYTNKERDGQFIKSVAPNSSADLAGMIVFDHVVGVDDVVVLGETHHQVRLIVLCVSICDCVCFLLLLQIVERVRTGSGKQKKILVIDIETEDEMKARGEEITMDKAIVMIPRQPAPQVETQSAPPLASTLIKWCPCMYLVAETGPLIHCLTRGIPTQPTSY